MTQSDPTPEEIAAMCLEIQAGWTPEQRLRRLRHDLRPQIILVDGTTAAVSAESLAVHEANGDAAESATPHVSGSSDSPCSRSAASTPHVSCQLQ